MINHQAINCNNHAVDLLRHGNNRLAISSLSDALQIIQRELLLNVNQEASDRTNEGGTSKGAMASQPFHNNSSKKTVSALPDSPCHISFAEGSLKDLQDVNYSIFNHPIVLSSEGNFGYTNTTLSKQEHQELLLQAIGASVLLNLALAYHREGVVQNNKACVKKASKLYDLAKDYISAALLVPQSSIISPIALVYLAAANNGIHCSLLEDGNYDIATQRLEELVCLVQQLPGLEPTLMNAIVLNALTMRTRKLCSASAA